LRLASSLCQKISGLDWRDLDKQLLAAGLEGGAIVGESECPAAGTDHRVLAGGNGLHDRLRGRLGGKITS
jgi:hypothetical protein